MRGAATGLILALVVAAALRLTGAIGDSVAAGLAGGLLFSLLIVARDRWGGRRAGRGDEGPGGRG